MLQQFLKERKDRAVWMPELRERFAHEEGSRPLILRLTLHDGSRRDFACSLPKGETGPESDLVSAFFFAEVYNILTVCSGRELRIFCDTGDGELRALFAELDEVFQRAKKARGGFGKVLNIAERIGGGCAFALSPIEEWQALPPAEKRKPGHAAYLDPDTPYDLQDRQAILIAMRKSALLEWIGSVQRK